jgi:hypothetical protein
MPIDSEPTRVGLTKGGDVKKRGMVGLALVLIAISAKAADKNGQFYVGGGVGGVGCPIFLNVMATARQLGGLHSPEGVDRINPYTN